MPTQMIITDTAGRVITSTMKTLLTEEQIREGVAQLAAEIESFYRDKPLTIIGILTGSLVLLADLIRRVEMPLRLGLIQAHSYRGTSTKPGLLRINGDFLPEVQDRDVLLVDDIFDTGGTLMEVMAQIDELRPRSLRTAVLLAKEGRQQVAYRPNYAAFNIPDEFVVGYGLDYNDMYRNLPYIAVLEEEDLEET
jgi:hypoxanthine phosphoribosyltransferase